MDSSKPTGPGEPAAGAGPGPGGPGLWALAGIGLTVGVCVAACLGGGLWLDTVTGRSPLFTLLGLVLGVVAAVLVVVRAVREHL